MESPLGNLPGGTFRRNFRIQVKSCQCLLELSQEWVAWFLSCQKDKHLLTLGPLHLQLSRLEILSSTCWQSRRLKAHQRSDVLVAKSCPSLAIPQTVARQAALTMAFPGRKTGVGCHSLLQGIFLTRDQTLVSCIAGRFYTVWATRLVLSPLNSVQFSCSVISLALCDPMDWNTPGFPVITNSQALLKLMSIELVMPFNHLVLCCHLLLLFSIFPSIRVFSNESVFPSGGQNIGAWALASVLPVSIQDSFPLGLTGLIFLLSKGLKSLLQHHSSKASILQCSAFFEIQLSHPYMTIEKAIALAIQTYVSKVINMLSKLVIAFLPRSKHLLISWLQHHLQWF